LYRAGQEGIAYAFKYGFDILKESNLQPTVIRAGKANMFLSEVFAQCFVNTLQVPVELYDTDGSVGAAIGAGIGAGIFADAKEAFANHTPVHTIVPDGDAQWYAEFYAMWKEKLQQQLK
jgi:xylulokinase